MYYSPQQKANYHAWHTPWIGAVIAFPVFLLFFRSDGGAQFLYLLEIAFALSVLASLLAWLGRPPMKWLFARTECPDWSAEKQYRVLLAGTSVIFLVYSFAPLIIWQLFLAATSSAPLDRKLVQADFSMMYWMFFLLGLPWLLAALGVAVRIHDKSDPPTLPY